jgi:uncharacterized phage-associated protein
MEYNASQIADYFLSKTEPERGGSITLLKLQKLVYYAQAWHYTIFEEALFNEDFEAWKHGPALWSIHNRFSGMGVQVYDSIKVTTINLDVPEFPKQTLKLLGEVHSLYGEHSGEYLEELTHNEPPWKDARKGVPPHERSNNKITLEAMKSYYFTLLKK